MSLTAWAGKQASQRLIVCVCVSVRDHACVFCLVAILVYWCVLVCTSMCDFLIDDIMLAFNMAATRAQ